MPLRFFNCPECDKPTFIKVGDESNTPIMNCEHCNKEFSVADDSRPFEMSVDPELNRSIYAF